MVQPAHTAHACRFCRQKRSKCDGRDPCDRCQRWEQACIYDDRAKETKGDLRKERDELLSRDRDASVIFKALQSGDLADETMASLWSRTPLEQIASKLAGPSDSTGQPSGSPALPDEAFAGKTEDTQDPILGILGDGIPYSPGNNNSADSPPSATGDASARPRRDTFTIQSPDLPADSETGSFQVEYPQQKPWELIGLDLSKFKSLLDVFFNWQYLPLFCVNREALEKDFLEGKQKNCSPALIRLIICLACRSIDGYDAVASYHVNLGGRLLQEATTLLGDPKGTTSSIPNAQAYGLMTLHELGSTRKREAITHVESCVRMLLALHSEESNRELGVSTITWASPLSTCFQGSVALARIIHLLFRSFHPSSPLDDDPKPKFTEWLSPESSDENEDVLKVLRTPTTIGPIPEEDQFSALLVTLTSSAYCFLSRLSMPVVGFPPDLLKLYHSYLSHYTGLIATVQSTRVTRTSILFIHLVYHFSLLSLCRPFSHIPSSVDAPIDFRAICLEAAQAIISLSTTYFEIVAARQLPVFVPLFTYAAGLISHELATSELSTFQPPSIPHNSSTESSRGTTTSRSGSSTSDAASWSIPTSPIGLSVPSERSGKRKINQISLSPLTTPMSTQAGSEVTKAVVCLGMVGAVFPMAREAEHHLKQLVPGSATDSPVQNIGYGFPLPRR